MDLSEYRKQLDRINGELLSLFLERMNISSEIAKYKQEKGLQVFDSEREKAILDEVRTKAGDDLGPYAEKFFADIMQLSRDRQNEVMCHGSKEDRDLTNIVLIGMPGAGKTTIGKLLGTMTGRRAIDADEEMERAFGMSIPEYFLLHGEDEFREKESEFLAEAAKEQGVIIMTGGGAVLRECNYAPLHEHGRIYQLDRDLSLLPIIGRPISRSVSLEELYRKRAPLYRRFRDVLADNNGTPEETALFIKKEFEDHFGN